MKKVLFITTRLIYPINDGRKVVLYNYCKGLAEKHGCEVRLFSIVEKEDEGIKQPKFIEKVYYSNTPSKLEKGKNLIFKSLLMNKWPLQVSLYYSKRTKVFLNSVINEYQPDVVIADMARTAEYLKDLDGIKYNKILDMDDILSKRYSRQIENGELGSNAIGAYSNKLPKFINKLMDNGKIINLILRKEVKLLSKYEIDISTQYRSLIFVSPIEANEFNDRIGGNKSIDITIGVDYKYLSTRVINEKKNDYVVFLGNMYVAHNKDAANSFIERVLPIILKNKPNCIFRIVGRCSDEYKVQMKKYKNVEVIGEVDDIRKYIQECNVAVAPLKYGSGIKTKVLESMAMGIPVITNDIGIEGIGVGSFLKNKMVKNSEQELAEAIIEIFNDDKYANSLSRLQQEFVEKKHRWNEILNRFENII